MPSGQERATGGLWGVTRGRVDGAGWIGLRSEVDSVRGTFGTINREGNAMTTPIRTALAAGCLFVGIVAGLIAPRFASAHEELTDDEIRLPHKIHSPEAPRNIQVKNRPPVEINGNYFPAL